MNMSDGFLELFFFPQIIYFIQLLCGYIETNPGPCYVPYHALNTVHLNARSIRNKINDLVSMVSDFDVLCATETHLNIIFGMKTFILTELMLYSTKTLMH